MNNILTASWRADVIASRPQMPVPRLGCRGRPSMQQPNASKKNAFWQGHIAISSLSFVLKTARRERRTPSGGSTLR